MSGGIDFSKIDFDNVKPVKVKMIRNSKPLQEAGLPRQMWRSWDMMACSWLGYRHIVLRAGKKHLRIKRSVENGIRVEPVRWTKRGLL